MITDEKITQLEKELRKARLFGENEVCLISQEDLRELLELARKLNVIYAIAHDPKYGSDPMWVLINVRGVLGLSTGITQMPGIALQEENAKLRAELVGSKVVLHSLCYCKEAPPGKCAACHCIKRIDDTLGDGNA